MRTRSAPSAGSPGEGHSISVKLSALHPRYEVAQYERCVPSLIEQVEALATLAASLEHPLHDRRRGDRAAGDEPRHHRGGGGPAGAEGLGRARHGDPGLWQARPADDRLGRTRSARRPAGGSRRGWSRAPIGTPRSSARRSRGFPIIRCSPARRRPTSPISPARRTCCAAKHIYPAFATHNALTVATLLEWAGESRDFEFQRLHGMGEGLYENLVREQGYHTRIYAPVGGHRDLLAYLVRRLLENGANSSSFVHQLADETSDRRRSARRSGREDRRGRRHPPSLDPAARTTCSCRSGRTAGGSTSTTGRSWSGSPKAVAPPLDFAAESQPASASELVDRALEGLRGLVEAQHRGARRLPRAARRPARARPRHADADRGAGGEEDHPRRARRGARGGRFLPLLRRPGAHEPAADRAARADRRAQRAADGGARRLGLHRAVELPARHLPRPGHGGAGGRQQRGRQARLADARDRRLCGRPRPRGGHSRGRSDPRRRPARHGPEADGGRAHRRRRLHRLDRDRQAYRPHSARRRRPRHHPADRRDRRDQRDDRRFHRSARAGGAGRRHLGLPLGRPALLGAAAAGAAGGCRRADAGDADRARWTA